MMPGSALLNTAVFLLALGLSPLTFAADPTLSPATPAQAVESAFKSLQDSPSEPLLAEQLLWAQSVKTTIPPETFQSLAAPRRQEILKTIQAAVTSLWNPKTGREFPSKPYCSAQRDLLILRLRRLSGLPALKPEPKAEIEKQIESSVDLVVLMAQDIRPDLLKHNAIRKSFRDLCLDKLLSQMNQTGSLAFKVPLTAADITQANTTLDKELKKFAADREIFMENLDHNARLTNLKNLKPEEQDKFLTENAPRIAGQIYQNIHPFDLYLRQLQEDSVRSTARIKSPSLDLAGGVSDKELRDAERLPLRIRQREDYLWIPRQSDIKGQTPDEIAHSILDDWTNRRRNIPTPGSSQQTASQFKAQREQQLNSVRETLSQILREEISTTDFARLDSTRRNAIVNRLVTLAQWLMNDKESPNPSPERQKLITKIAQLDIRREVRIPLMLPEEKSKIDSQLDRIITRIIDLTAQKKPELFLGESIRDCYRDALQS